jgi:hypothetical protein
MARRRGTSDAAATAGARRRSSVSRDAAIRAHGARTIGERARVACGYAAVARRHMVAPRRGCARVRRARVAIVTAGVGRAARRVGDVLTGSGARRGAAVRRARARIDAIGVGRAAIGHGRVGARARRDFAHIGRASAPVVTVRVGAAAPWSSRREARGGRVSTRSEGRDAGAVAFPERITERAGRPSSRALRAVEPRAARAQQSRCHPHGQHHAAHLCPGHGAGVGPEAPAPQRSRTGGLPPTA